jgi:hypothetical protein
MQIIWQRYDASATDGASSATAHMTSPSSYS